MNSGIGEAVTVEPCFNLDFHLSSIFAGEVGHARGQHDNIGIVINLARELNGAVNGRANLCAFSGFHAQRKHAVQINTDLSTV